jgi:hypothetical protein
MTSADKKRFPPSYLGPLVFLVTLLAIPAYRHFRSSPMDGVWLRKTGVAMVWMPGGTSFSVMPDEISTRLTRSQFTTRSWGFPAGLEHITLQLDGREHLYQSIYGTDVKVTYRAQMDGAAVVVPKHTFTPSKDMGSFTERWSVEDGGHRLTVSVGKDEIVYGRPPLLRSLFRASP